MYNANEIEDEMVVTTTTTNTVKRARTSFNLSAALRPIAVLCFHCFSFFSTSEISLPLMRLNLINRRRCNFFCVCLSASLILIGSNRGEI